MRYEYVSTTLCVEQGIIVNFFKKNRQFSVLKLEFLRK